MSPVHDLLPSDQAHSAEAATNRASVFGRTLPWSPRLDIFRYGHTMCPWHEPQRRQMRSMRWPSPGGGRSWTSSPAENDP